MRGRVLTTHGKAPPLLPAGLFIFHNGELILSPPLLPHIRPKRLGYNPPPVLQLEQRQVVGEIAWVDCTPLRNLLLWTEPGAILSGMKEAENANNVVLVLDAVDDYERRSGDHRLVEVDIGKKGAGSGKYGKALDQETLDASEGPLVGLPAVSSGTVLYLVVDLGLSTGRDDQLHAGREKPCFRAIRSKKLVA